MGNVVSVADQPAASVTNITTPAIYTSAEPRYPESVLYTLFHDLRRCIRSNRAPSVSITPSPGSPAPSCEPSPTAPALPTDQQHIGPILMLPALPACQQTPTDFNITY
ncbi:hypothetical protein CGMCC3_g16884 [Colletotrichum fructicola]|nr:uncharacterized protein CGMCC3_g16884 [Colletotrichum fructicola]KAE9566945.1 hypothetical protein CGMCC3_g16884 [Colletotrichum fructicola]